MGLDTKAMLVVGIKTENRSVKETKVRYDEETGKPYDKEFTSTKVFIVGQDVEVATEEWAECCGKEIGFLHIGEETILFGQSVASTDSHRRQQYLTSVPTTLPGNYHGIEQQVRDAFNKRIPEAHKDCYNVQLLLVNHMSW